MSLEDFLRKRFTLFIEKNTFILWAFDFPEDSPLLFKDISSSILRLITLKIDINLQHLERTQSISQAMRSLNQRRFVLWLSNDGAMIAVKASEPTTEARRKVRAWTGFLEHGRFAIEAILGRPRGACINRGFSAPTTKKPWSFLTKAFCFGCARRIWTYDLWVMSPTSYQTAPSRGIFYLDARAFCLPLYRHPMNEL